MGSHNKYRVDWKVTDKGPVLKKEEDLFVYVHPKDDCDDSLPCIVHSPSDHHMRKWARGWNADMGRFFRTCVHGKDHPDPDDSRYLVEVQHWVLVKCPCTCKCCIPPPNKIDYPAEYGIQTGSIKVSAPSPSLTNEQLIELTKKLLPKIKKIKEQPTS